jgi:pyruvate formate lyase activating enzyme
MKIAKKIQSSMIDYPGKMSEVIFFPRCNLNCPSCYAKSILNGYSENISQEEIIGDFEKRAGWLDGLVLLGGEPTAENLDELILFLEKIKNIKLNFRGKKVSIKLDTNGFNPVAVEKLIEKELIDYVALDIKAPKQLYNAAAGKDVNLELLENTIQILEKNKQKGFGYEFRTTLYPFVRNSESVEEVLEKTKQDENYAFLNLKEIEDMVRWIYGVVQDSDIRWYVQEFQSLKGELRNSDYEKFPNTSEEKLKQAEEVIGRYFKSDIR